jgi:hypothetical protein
LRIRGSQKEGLNAKGKPAISPRVQGRDCTTGPLFRQIHFTDRQRAWGLRYLFKKLKVKQAQIGQGQREGLRACLVSDRVRLEEAESAAFLRTKASCGPSCGVDPSIFEASLPKRAIGGRSSVGARTPERFSPHLCQTRS